MRRESSLHGDDLGSREGGFTLLELVITLSIVVVLTGVVVLRVAGWTPRQKLHASARSLGNALRTWRERAISEEAVYRLAFTQEGWTVSDASGALVGRGRLSAGQVLEAPDGVVFDRRGILSPLRFVIRNAGGDGLAVVPGTVMNEIDYAEAR